MKILKLLLFLESRKVAYGLWLFIVSTLFLYRSIISSDNWIFCTLMVSALIGGGTVTDKYLDKRK